MVVAVSSLRCYVGQISDSNHNTLTKPEIQECEAPGCCGGTEQCVFYRTQPKATKFEYYECGYHFLSTDSRYKGVECLKGRECCKTDLCFDPAKSTLSGTSTATISVFTIVGASAPLYLMM